MTRFSWHGCIADVDERAAGAWYAKVPDWNCPCGHCGNFAALARVRKLPAALPDMLGALPIPPEKATWACELYHGEDWAEKRLLCEFSWRIAGKIAGRPEGESGDSGRGPLVKFSWGGLMLGYETFSLEPAFPAPHFDLNCAMYLPGCWTRLQADRRRSKPWQNDIISR